MTEPRDHQLKRLTMRSMRRGIKEMDIILSRYAELRLEGFDETQLAQYDALLSENDQDLYQWVSGQKPPPEPLHEMISDIARVAFQH